MARGRPSVYKDEYCERVIEWMSRGYSVTACAGLIGISRETFYAWQRDHAEFAECVGIGQAKRVLFQENRMLHPKDKLDLTAAIFAAKCTGDPSWREKQEIELSGSGGGPVKIEWVVVDPLAKPGEV